MLFKNSHHQDTKTPSEDRELKSIQDATVKNADLSATRHSSLVTPHCFGGLTGGVFVGDAYGYKRLSHNILNLNREGL
jgi:hypothetical protein